MSAPGPPAAAVAAPELEAILGLLDAALARADNLGAHQLAARIDHAIIEATRLVIARTLTPHQ